MRAFLLVCFSLLTYARVSAQTPPAGAVPTIIPPSPTAAALEKYGQVPVSPYTGVPNISVPLYEIKVRDLSIPISLNYHAGGFRVSEEASWVGLGWSLLAGGAITRTVRNLDDLQYFIRRSTESYPFIMPDPTTDGQGDTYSGFYTLVRSCQRLYVNGERNSDAHCGNVVGPGLSPYADWEPDDFRFSMGNYSGQFAFQQDGTIRVLEQQKIKIEPPTREQPQAGWKITTPDGFRYFFTAEEVNYAVTPLQQQQRTTTAWYLTRIVSPLGEEATLTYSAGAFTYPQAAFTESQIMSFQGGCAPLSNNGTYQGSFSMGWSTPQYLERITFKSGYVAFEREPSERADLRGGQRLKRLALYNAAGELQKAYSLQASYFEAPATSGGGHLPANDPGIPYEGKRLRLDAVVESGRDGAPKPATSFVYNATPLPVKSAYTVDFWGYNNGVNNTTLLPEYAGSDLGAYLYRPGADRQPAAGPMLACMLKTITYPTGGHTTFTFEPHEYSNVAEQDYPVTQTNVPLRFAQDNVNSLANIDAETFSVTVPTPLVLEQYTLRAESRESRRVTQLQLLNDVTGQPLYTWGFPDPDNYNAPNEILERGKSVLLPPGRYRFAANLLSCGSSCHGYVQVDASYSRMEQVTATTTRLAGGLRVRRIEDYDGVHPAPNQIRQYEYSGVLMSRPVFSKVTAYKYADPNGNDNTNPPCITLQRLSYNQSCFSAGARGSTVGYSFVRETHGAQGEGGKTEYSYHCLPDREPRYGDRLPNIPTRSEELNGYLREQATYRQTTAGGYQLVAKTENEYESVNRIQLTGIYRGAWYVSQNSSQISDGNGNYTLTAPTYTQPFYYYTIGSRWVQLTQTTTRQYDPQDGGKFLTTTTRYRYDTGNKGHQQLSQTETTRSDGSTLVTTNTYPADYTNVTSGSLAAMRSDAIFQHSAVIESVTQLYSAGQTAADAKTVAGSYTEYTQPSATSRYLPITQQALELTEPTAGLGVATPTLPPAGRYATKVQLSYEAASANIQQAQRHLDGPTSYLWGYQKTLPIAQVQNASASQVEAARQELGLDFEALTANPSDANAAQLRQALAQLRQRLPQARITGFTHRPLVGLTSQTDPGGRTTYYEYDALGRLLRTRDEQGRILSQQQYHYASQ